MKSSFYPRMDNWINKYISEAPILAKLSTKLLALYFSNEPLIRTFKYFAFPQKGENLELKDLRKAEVNFFDIAAGNGKFCLKNEAANAITINNNISQFFVTKLSAVLFLSPGNCTKHWVLISICWIDKKVKTVSKLNNELTWNRC